MNKYFGIHTFALIVNKSIKIVEKQQQQRKTCNDK